jgi:hypothetical protein
MAPPKGPSSDSAFDLLGRPNRMSYHYNLLRLLAADFCCNLVFVSFNNKQSASKYWIFLSEEFPELTQWGGGSLVNLDALRTRPHTFGTQVAV